MYVCVD